MRADVVLISVLFDILYYRQTSRIRIKDGRHEKTTRSKRTNETRTRILLCHDRICKCALTLFVRFITLGGYSSSSLMIIIGIVIVLCHLTKQGSPTLNPWIAFILASMMHYTDYFMSIC